MGGKFRAAVGSALVVSTIGLGSQQVHAITNTKSRPHSERPAAAAKDATWHARMHAAEVARADLGKALAYVTVLEDQRIAVFVTILDRAYFVQYLDGIARNAAALAAASRPASHAVSHTRPVARWSGGGDTTNGTLACIRHHESDSAGGYSAVNPSSGASGAYQALDSTWAGYAGYAHAAEAPPAVQDQWARSAIAQSGTRPWAGSGC